MRALVPPNGELWRSEGGKGAAPRAEARLRFRATSGFDVALPPHRCRALPADVRRRSASNELRQRKAIELERLNISEARVLPRSYFRDAIENANVFFSWRGRRERRRRATSSSRNENLNLFLIPLLPLSLFSLSTHLNSGPRRRQRRSLLHRQEICHQCSRRSLGPRLAAQDLCPPLGAGLQGVAGLERERGQRAAREPLGEDVFLETLIE